MRAHNSPGAWAHAIATLRGWWLPGDRRGFHSRDHRIHSSGVYGQPPPPEEHAGLREWAKTVATRVPALTSEERRRAGEAVVDALRRRGRRPLVVACAATHLHALFDAGEESATEIFGRAKQLAARRVGRNAGRLWGQGAGIDRIRTRAHQLRAFRYILAHARDGAWAWRFDSGRRPTR